ncbi:MAG: hypothetical protein IPG55_09710 [Saprospiraceae bacterium]|nr:hypothetical protein [Candidatus Defluviibacterium haderslevense]MBK7243866.1 hypothetical protein [Candidatus Defluviibacterium haderslevense]
MPTVNEKFKECFEIFSTKAIDKDGSPNACKIHDAFGGMEGEHHNCLGCNFADCTNLISRYLKNNEELTDIQQDFTVYLLLLYLLVERVEIVFDIIQLPETYREKHFKVFQQIRKWANFIKHPKSFILTHHPEYDFENSRIIHDREFSETINEIFVTQFYKGFTDPVEQQKHNKDLYLRLRNKKNVLVLFPDIAILTNKLCYSYNKFVELILSNEVYKEILNDETTISAYFEK